LSLNYLILGILRMEYQNIAFMRDAE